jgi:starch synthase
MKKLKILMPAAEAAPFAKVGGLADVVGSLPPALKKLGCDVRVIMPKYGSIDEGKFMLKKIREQVPVPSDGKSLKVDVWQGTMPGKGVTVYFIEHKKFFGRKEVYHGNNAERFLFFSQAALHVLPVIDFRPDIIHCHDFHTALIPDLLKCSDYAFFSGIKTLLTIHNLNYQGASGIEILSTANLSKDSLHSLKIDARDGDINFMVQGILNADLVNTVSKKYAREIRTAFYGAKLDNILEKRKSDLSGILNGIDTDLFDPAKDKLIKSRYSAGRPEAKRRNKAHLQKRLGLEPDPAKPLAGLISRFVWQKGIDLFTEDFLRLDCQYVFLGTGAPEYEEQIRRLAKKYPDRFSANLTFDLGLAQEIYAGSDLFLMPSRFEPCGLGQMIAMRYGSLPVVRRTGGLADTVDAKVGFSFADFSAEAFLGTLKKAVNLYHKDQEKWQAMVKEAMGRDFSWRRSAQEYLGLYKKILK